VTINPPLRGLEVGAPDTPGRAATSDGYQRAPSTWIEGPALYYLRVGSRLAQGITASRVASAVARGRSVVLGDPRPSPALDTIVRG